jgi:hypothetical protein
VPEQHLILVHSQARAVRDCNAAHHPQPRRGLSRPYMMIVGLMIMIGILARRRARGGLASLLMSGLKFPWMFNFHRARLRVGLRPVARA